MSVTVRVSGCKDALANAMTDPEGDTGTCIAKDEIKVSGSLEEEYSPKIYCPCIGGLSTSNIDDR